MLVCGELHSVRIGRHIAYFCELSLPSLPCLPGSLGIISAATPYEVGGLQMQWFAVDVGQFGIELDVLYEVLGGCYYPQDCALLTCVSWSG